MSEHESQFLKVLEAKLKKHYTKYLVSLGSFLILSCVGFYVSVRIALAENLVEHKEFSEKIANHEARINNLNMNLFNHCNKK